MPPMVPWSNVHLVKKKHRKDDVYRAARRAEYGALWPEVVD